MNGIVILSQRSTPITQYGVSIAQPQAQNTIPYDGTLLPYFLMSNGGDPKNYRQLLKDNKIGSVFDLEPGEILNVPAETGHGIGGAFSPNLNA